MGDFNVALCCFCFIYLIAMIIFACSFATLEPNEAGLVYNSVTQVLNKEKVYTGGRYLVGPGMTFMVFPLYAQNIDLDNQLVTSQSKQQFTISVSLQYKLLNTEKGEIVSIYNNYNNKLSALNSQLMSIAVQAIKETAAMFPTASFYGGTSIGSRGTINDQLFLALQQDFTDTFCELVGVQVKDINFSASPIMVSSYNQNIVAAQGNEKAKIDQQVRIMVQDGLTYANSGAVAQQVALASANGYGQEIIASATGEAFALALSTKSLQYSTIISKLHLSQQQLIQYLYLKTLESKTGMSHILAGFDQNSGMLRDNLASYTY